MKNPFHDGLTIVKPVYFYEIRYRSNYNVRFSSYGVIKSFHSSHQSIDLEDILEQKKVLVFDRSPRTRLKGWKAGYRLC